MQELGNRSSSPSAKLSFFLSLITRESDYQRAQAASAEDAARRLNVAVEISYADNDAIQQSQQLLQVIHNRSSEIRALIFEPAGNTAFPQVAHAAAAAGLGWVVINRSTGNVLTAENMPNPASASLGIGKYLLAARQAAIYGEQMGGR